MRTWILLAPLAWALLTVPLPGMEPTPVCDLSPEELLPCEPFSHDLLCYREPVARRWDLAVKPFTGSRWPANERRGERTREDYGLQLGATWVLSSHLRMGFELPYAIGQFSSFSAADSVTSGNDALPDKVTRIEGMLTLSVQF